jgi:hypothetical protein
MEIKKENENVNADSRDEKTGKRKKGRVRYALEKDEMTPIKKASIKGRVFEFNIHILAR